MFDLDNFLSRNTSGPRPTLKIDAMALGPRRSGAQKKVSDDIF